MLPPVWLTALAAVPLGIAVLTAGLILYDIYGRNYRQRMMVMEPVWVITAPYFGPAAWCGYRRWDRPNSPLDQQQRSSNPEHGERISVAVGVSHCGAGFTLGDIMGAWIVFAVSSKLCGLALPAEYIADFTLGFALGIAFQYFSIAPMRGLGPRDGITAAIKADTLSLIASRSGRSAGWRSSSSCSSPTRTSPPITPPTGC